ncbi:MAG: choice-of-anchor Q domain-containing protein [Anaerolineae bacterium]
MSVQHQRRLYPLCGLVVVLVGMALLIGSPTRAQGQVQIVGPIQALINTAPDGGTVIVPAGLFTESLNVSKNITLTGAGYNNTILRAPAGLRIITVIGNVWLRITDLQMTGGNPTGDVGGAIKTNAGILQINNCWLVSNSAAYGGAIFQDGETGQVYITYSKFAGNHSANHGGALFIRGSAVISYTYFWDNSANIFGGAIQHEGPEISLLQVDMQRNVAGSDGAGLNANNDVTVTGGQFIDNHAGRYGGGLQQYNSGKTVLLTDVLFQNNTAQRGGGAYVAQGTTTTITASDFISNRTSYLGGGLAQMAGSLTVQDSIFSANVVSDSVGLSPQGGGIYASGSVVIENSQFTGNSLLCYFCSSMPGAGLMANISSNSRVSDSQFYNNSGWNGGGLSCAGTAEMLVQRVIFQANYAGYGAAIDTGAALMRIDASTFTTNTALNAGGAIQAGYPLQVEHSLFQGNSSRNDKGGAINTSAPVSINQSKFINNYTIVSAANGGAVASGKQAWITNTLFISNSAASGKGSAVYHYPPAPVWAANLTNCTISYPTVRTGSAVEVYNGTLALANNIINNYAVGVEATNSTVTFDYNLVNGGSDSHHTGGSFLWMGTLTGDPLFVNPAAGDYHLSWGSPAIDSGKIVAVPTDLDGRKRPLGAGYDRGAYEYQPVILVPLVIKN